MKRAQRKKEKLRGIGEIRGIGRERKKGELRREKRDRESTEKETKVKGEWERSGGSAKKKRYGG